jgi:hypothetical protein
MALKIDENTKVTDLFYLQARDMTLENLPAFINELLSKYKHDYGTICHAFAAGAIATMWAMNKDEKQGGITGFQGSAIMWEFITHWDDQYADKPLKLINYEHMLYPQYAYDFEKVISEATWNWLKENAQKKLEDNPGVHESVKEHWRKIATGFVPFGYKVESEAWEDENASKISE